MKSKKYLPTIKMHSPAKINLGLDILRRREDGYHEVRMVMQTIDLCDELELARREEPGISLSCPGTDLPCDERNLAYKAAALLLDEFEISGGLSILINKKIPMEAGLAGGSGNAAAVLKGVNQLFELGLTLQELCVRGARIGADVPYCLMGGTALAEGIGEKLTPLPKVRGGSLLIVKPPVGVSTAWAYKSWDALDDPEHPPVRELADLLREGADICEAARLFGNSFEPLIFEREPIVREIREELTGSGAAGSLMSGSGPSLFAVFETDEEMAGAAARMRELYPDAFVQEAHLTD